MNLTIADLRDLPLACALVDAQDNVIAQTPEWQGDGLWAASYPVRRNRLVVSTEPAAHVSLDTLEFLLHELDAAAGELTRPTALLVRMLAGSLRLVAGRRMDSCAPVPSAEVIDCARAGISARTGLAVLTGPAEGVTGLGLEAIALILVQLAVNAERHGKASSVTLTSEPGAFHVAWRGEAPAGRLATSRRRVLRERWGLGFARIAADALGAVVHMPHRRGDGLVVATVETGVGRLSLPLAAVRDGSILRATRAWDEETGLTPGTPVATAPFLAEAARIAADNPDALVRSGAATSRAARGLVWLAVPPDDIIDRARDVLDGLGHERVLTDAVGEPRRSRISGAAMLLGSIVGTPVQRVPASSWVRRMRELAGPFSLPMPVPDYEGVGAVDPSLCALLASEIGEAFEVDGDALWLRLRAERLTETLAAQMAMEGGRRIRLG